MRIKILNTVTVAAEPRLDVLTRNSENTSCNAQRGQGKQSIGHHLDGAEVGEPELHPLDGTVRRAAPVRPRHPALVYPADA
jgi:hypothetical protein